VPDGWSIQKVAGRCVYADIFRDLSQSKQRLKGGYVKIVFLYEVALPNHAH